MNRFVALMNREFIEHRTGFLIVPAVISLIMVGSMVLSMMFAEIQMGSPLMVDGVAIHDLDEFLSEEMQDVDADELAQGITAAIFATAMPIFITIPFILVFTLLSSLYDDRRDRSVLFWKSMPISDWQEIGAKFVGTTGLGVGMVFAIALVTQLAFILFLTLFGLVKGVPVIEYLWKPVSFFGPWFNVISLYVLWLLWALPILGWLMLISAVARKAPLLIAIVPIVVAVAIEGIVLGSSYLAEWVARHLSAGMTLGDLHGNFTYAGIEGELIASYGQSFTSVHFWAGLAIAGGLIWGTREMRRIQI